MQCRAIWEKVLEGHSLSTDPKDIHDSRWGPLGMYVKCITHYSYVSEMIYNAWYTSCLPPNCSAGWNGL